MKPEEMMLGDWISFNGEPVKVVHIVSGINEDDYNPIPITAELLEKNGFKKYGDTGWWLEDDYYDIQIYEWSDSIWVFKYESTEMNTPYEQRTFSYVHNLQHALRECGIDEEIDL